MTFKKPSLTSSIANSERAMHLDGIRGVAALTVAIFHFARSFDNSLLSSEQTINHTFISTLWNGHFAVALFFVLSGFLFFEKFYCKTIDLAITAAAKRYLRLCIPILAICLIAYAIHRFDLYPNKQASIASGSDWLGRWYAFSPDIRLAITESFWSDFVSFDATRTYNSNLWTISYELFAVFLIIAFGIICRHVNFLTQILILTTAAILSFGSHYLEFILGAFLALACIKRKISIPLPAAIVLTIAGLSLAPMALPNQVITLAADLLYPVAAALFIGSINSNSTLRSFFSNRCFVKLGEISFGLYLTHFIVLNSAASAFFIFTGSITATFALYLAVTAAASFAFTYAIDKPWMKYLNKNFTSRKYIDSISKQAK
ncbi:acyltransferase family protein [Pseudomonas sp. 210_17 TE3656]